MIESPRVQWVKYLPHAYTGHFQTTHSGNQNVRQGVSLFFCHSWFQILFHFHFSNNIFQNGQWNLIVWGNWGTSWVKGSKILWSGQLYQNTLWRRTAHQMPWCLVIQSVKHDILVTQKIIRCGRGILAHHNKTQQKHMCKIFGVYCIFFSPKHCKTL